ncbi:MAG: DUF1579 domain-containing protein [Allosphingosinicella sp.]
MTKILLVATLIASAASAQPESAPNPSAGPWDPAARMAAQREAMKALAFLDGEWRGTARAEEAPGEMRHTERVGTLLDGTVRLVEGRGYDSAGKTQFNAFAIISYDPVKRSYSMRSHAMGYAGDYPLTVRPDGFSWSHPAGPGAVVRYTATVKDGEWHEVGERVGGDSPPAKTVELRVRRIGAGGWPEKGAVPPR